MPNFVQLGRTVAGIWPFSIFQDGGCPPSWMFKIWEILTAFGGPKMRHRTKFCADRSNRCGDMAVFNFSRWRTSAILDFQKWEILTGCTLRGPKCVILPNFVQIGQGVAEIWPFSFFQDGGRPPSCIFKSWKF